MLNIRFPAGNKIELWDLTVCIGKWRTISKSPSDLDLGPTMPDIEPVRNIFIYYNVFQFHVPRSITF